jgi:hypothetical protein
MGKVFQDCAVDLDIVHRFCRELKKILKVYGFNRFSIRVFALSDVERETVSFWRPILATMRQYFNLHAITKQYSTIERLSDLLDRIQLSIDSVGSTDIMEAIKLRFSDPGKYRIRCVMLSEDDAHLADVSDIITLYHGNTIDGLKTYRTNHASYLKLTQKTANVYQDRVVCCQTGKCTSCGLCHETSRNPETGIRETTETRETTKSL